MRLPNHIALDFFSVKSAKHSNYWVTDITLLLLNNQPIFLNRKFLSEKIVSHKRISSNTVFDDNKFDLHYVNNVLTNFNTFFGLTTVRNVTCSFDNLPNLINLNFLRKERLYTKLKYSRSPAYDIVSGGAAALFAGLLGFLISEKFGFELVDSGDFYYLFMYGVFAVFSLRPLLVVTSARRGFFNVISLRHIINFYKTLLVLIMKLFK